MAEYTNLNLSLEGPIALLTLNRPEAMNALDTETLRELGAAIEEVEVLGRGLKTGFQLNLSDTKTMRICSGLCNKRLDRHGTCCTRVQRGFRQSLLIFGTLQRPADPDVGKLERCSLASQSG